MADTWKVVRQRNGRESVVFEGTEDDARRFIGDNYPRVHVEPGSNETPRPDALLKSPTGDYESCVGTQTIGNATVPHFVDTDEDGVPTDNADSADEDEDDEDLSPVPAEKTSAKKTAAKKTAASPPTF